MHIGIHAHVTIVHLEIEEQTSMRELANIAHGRSMNM